jgi:PAS domain-containing protein
VDVITEVRREETLLKTGALQNAIFTSANFSSIATDEKGVIQIFNVGAERTLGYAAADVVNKITPADFRRTDRRAKPETGDVRRAKALANHSEGGALGMSRNRARILASHRVHRRHGANR